jgi:DNA-directed RNA polymerase subunit RPC12/RpoP
MNAGRAHCMACGKELPLWFTPDMTGEEDDTVYEMWLDTPCPECGSLPRQFLPKKHEMVH